MRTYEETFERVMAGRDSYMRRKKERTKMITTGSIALAGVALAVVSVFAIRNRQQPSAMPAGTSTGAADETAEAYTAPGLLTQEVTSYFGAEESTQISEENGSAISASSEKNTQAAASGSYDTFNEVRYASKTDGETSLAAATTVRGETRPATATATVKSSTTVALETEVYMNYTYYINSGKYKNYCPGKVIEKDKVGEKAGQVTVTGYWEGYGAVSEDKTQKETLSADVYYIKGVSDDVAVCLKFNDKGDALTTTHYYVVINPDADYTPVREYVIGSGSAKTVTDNDVTSTSNPVYRIYTKAPENTRSNNEYVTGVTSTSKAYIPE